MAKDIFKCKHEFVPQDKHGIPSLLPFYCKKCGVGSWYLDGRDLHRFEPPSEELKQKLRRHDG